MESKVDSPDEDEVPVRLIIHRKSVRVVDEEDVYEKPEYEAVPVFISKDDFTNPLECAKKAI